MKHNFRSHPLYHKWRGMFTRCYNENCEDYFAYGGRGITVCERWHNPWNFIEDMGDCPEGFSLDRRDCDGNYEPSNCRWADPNTQAYNQRLYKSNKSGHKGVTWDKQHGKWCARISKNNKRYLLGRFSNLEDAILARKEGEKQFYET